MPLSAGWRHTPEGGPSLCPDTGTLPSEGEASAQPVGMTVAVLLRTCQMEGLSQESGRRSDACLTCPTRNWSVATELVQRSSREPKGSSQDPRGHPKVSLRH